MARPRTLLVLALLLLAAAVWLLDSDPTPPADALGPPTGAPPPKAATATADHAAPDASGDLAARSEATPDRAAPVYVVRGVVVGDRRSPDLQQLRVLAYRGEPTDAPGFITGAMATMQRGVSAPSFELTGDPIAECAVGPDDSFELRAATPHLRITVDHDFYLLPVPEVVHVGATTRERRLVLSPLLGAKVQGRLLGARAAAVDEVALTLEPDPLSMLRDARLMMAATLASMRPAARPDDQGAFVFRAVAPSASMVLGVDGHEVAGKLREPALHPGEVRDVVLPVQQAALLAVEVVAEDGAPLAQVDVLARSARGGGVANMIRPHHERTDDRGRCVFDRLEPGSYRVEATARGRVPARREVDVSPGASDPAQLLRLTLGEGGVVTGVVRAPDGAPLAGARVAHHPAADVPLLGELTEELGPQYMQQVAATGAETDEEGRFRLGGISDEGAFLVAAAHDDYGAGVARGVRIGDEDVEVRLRQLSGVLGVAKRADDGSPVARFTVSASRTAFLVMQMPVATETFEDPSGAFALRGLDPGDYTLRVTADGFGAAERSVTVREGEDVAAGDFALQQAASIRGVVRDEQGTPVANAMVRKRKGAMADNPMLAMMMGPDTSTYTDADGSFVLEPVRPGKLQLLATADGFASGRSARVAVAPGQQLEGVVIELDHGGAIEGRLRWSAQQTPGDFVLLVQHQVTQTATAADLRADGTFRVENLDPGAYQVQAMPSDLMNGIQGHDWRPGEGLDLSATIKKVTDGVVSQRCRVRAGEATAVELDVRDVAIGAQWSVRVDVAGAPLRAGIIEATSLETGALRVAMLEDSVAVFGRVDPGRHRLQVRAGLTMTPVGAPQDLTYPAGADEHTSTLSLPGGELRGRVVDDDTGAPLRSAMVRLHHDGHSEQDDPVGACVTDAEGAFVFSGLTDGAYSLVAGGARTASGEATASRANGVEVLAGAARDPVELRARPAAGATVQVTTLDGRPLRGATVLCVDAQGRPLGGLGAAVTGPDGRAFLGGMADGPARVVGRAPGYAPGVTAVQTLSSRSSARFELRLGPGAPTRVAAVDGAGRRLRGATVSARLDDGPWLPPALLVQQVGADGTVDVGALSPGRWSFRVQHPSIGTVTRARTISGTTPVSIVVDER